MLTIDGSTGEGGGQVLRTVTAMAALLRQPVRIENIRGNRPKPGMRAQHATGIKALCRLTGGRGEGLSVGSREVIFMPGDRLKKELKLDIGTAGSITLLLQGLLPVLAGRQQRVRLSIKGGTDVSWSPPLMYFIHVLTQLLDRMGVGLRSEMVRAGFYPKGGGEVRVAVDPPDRVVPLVMRAGHGVSEFSAFAVSSRDLAKQRVAERLITGARSILPDLKAKKLYVDTLSTGCSVVLVAGGETALVGADSLGERGTSAEEIGQRAAGDLELQVRSGCTVDRWAADQLLPFMGLAHGRSSILVPEVSPHARTNMEIIEKFLDARFEVREAGDCFRIECEGVGFGNA